MARRSATRNPHQIFRDFHGRAPDAMTSIRMNIPEGLIFLGRAVAIEYESDKRHGGGDGTKAVYRHECGKGNILCTDEGRRQLYILGPSQIITERGIVR